MAFSEDDLLRLIAKLPADQKWATEATLKIIADRFSKSRSKENKIQEDNNKINIKQKNIIESLIGSYQNNIYQLNRSGLAFNRNTKSLFDVGKSILGMNKGFTLLGSTMGIFSIVLQTAINGLLDVSEASYNMGKSGISFKNGLVDLSNGVRTTGLSIEFLSTAAIENSNLWTAFTNNNKTGLEVFKDLYTNASKYDKQTKSVFFTQKELIGAITDYQKILVHTGKSDKINELLERNAQNEYLDTLSQMSRNFGTTTDAISKLFVKTASDVEFFSMKTQVAGQYGQKAAEAFDQISAGLMASGMSDSDAKGVGAFLSNMLSSPDFVKKSSWYAATGMEGSMKNLQQAMQKGLTGNELKSYMKEINKASGEAMKDKRLIALAMSGRDEGMMAHIKMLNTVSAQFQDIDPKKQEFIDSMVRLKNSWAEFKTRMTPIGTTLANIGNMLLDEKFYSLLGKNLKEAFFDTFVVIGKNLKEAFFDSIFNVGELIGEYIIAPLLDGKFYSLLGKNLKAVFFDSIFNVGELIGEYIIEPIINFFKSIGDWWTNFDFKSFLPEWMRGKEAKNTKNKSSNKIKILSDKEIFETKYADLNMGGKIQRDRLYNENKFLNSMKETEYYQALKKKYKFDDIDELGTSVYDLYDNLKKEVGLDSDKYYEGGIEKHQMSTDEFTKLFDARLKAARSTEPAKQFYEKVSATTETGKVEEGTRQIQTTPTNANNAIPSSTDQQANIIQLALDQLKTLKFIEKYTNKTSNNFDTLNYTLD